MLATSGHVPKHFSKLWEIEQVVMQRHLFYAAIALHGSLLGEPETLKGLHW
jgi:hypothetical protein